MPMKITFELSDKDLRYFKRIAKEIHSQSTKISEEKMLAAVQETIREIKASRACDFVTQRLTALDQMVNMLTDEEWDMTGKDRERVADGLLYFAEGEDMIPDRIPGLGYLDDAIMIELVVRDLQHEIQAYDDFCTYRSSKTKLLGKKKARATSEEWLGARRSQLQARMRRRRRGGRTRHS